MVGYKQHIVGWGTICLTFDQVSAIARILLDNVDLLITNWTKSFFKSLITFDFSPTSKCSCLVNVDLE